MKLIKLVEELGGKDINDFLREMEDADFRSSLETKLPAYNTRVKLPSSTEKLPTFEGKLHCKLYLRFNC